jgi:hypothetical protein
LILPKEEEKILATNKIDRDWHDPPGLPPEPQKIQTEQPTEYTLTLQFMTALRNRQRRTMLLYTGMLYILIGIFVYIGSVAGASATDLSILLLCAGIFFLVVGYVIKKIGDPAWK